MTTGSQLPLSFPVRVEHPTPTVESLTEELRAEKGKARAAANRDDLLVHARKIAVKLALQKPDRCLCADDVQEALMEEGRNSWELGNAAGSLFKGDRWEYTGRMVKSRRAGSHSNLLRVWRLKGV